MLRNTVDHIWETQHEKLWPSSSSSPQAHNERWCKDRLAKGVVGGFLQEERRGCCSARGVHIPAAWANLGTAHHPTGHSGKGKSSPGQIHIAIWTNTNCNLDDYILQFMLHSHSRRVQSGQPPLQPTPPLVIVEREGEEIQSLTMGGKVLAEPKTKIALSPQHLIWLYLHHPQNECHPKWRLSYKPRSIIENCFQQVESQMKKDTF